MDLLIFLAVLVLLIIVHEFGHFLAAKKAGVRVDEFGIGFPPRLFGFRKGETEYTLNLIPFGGFVKIFGEDPDAEALLGPDKERSLAESVGAGCGHCRRCFVTSSSRGFSFRSATQ